ncbi:MAG: tetraacyldisaccharide 4'-kinase [Rickettsiaceae bacterium]|nr:tetraacyldisaccharide 4'-kinase [Rickettsiaceae bacterium]
MIKLNYPVFWQKSGLIPLLLTPFSWIYIILGIIRKFFAKQLKLPAPVICVGNITVGGTGKTPTIIWLANFLKQQNINFVIITKAYKSKLKKGTLVNNHHLACEVGDESLLLRNHGRVIATKKITDSVPILNDLKPEIILVDDGLQNPNFHKDIKILTIDALRGLGNGKIFPAGALRNSPKKALKNIDLIFMIGNSKCQDEYLIRIIENSNKPLFKAKFNLITQINKQHNYYAFCGIGNPDKFYSLLKEYKIPVIKTLSFPDHHQYLDQELTALNIEANKHQATLITTKKDYVKIPEKFAIKYVDIELSFENEHELNKLLYAKISEQII